MNEQALPSATAQPFTPPLSAGSALSVEMIQTLKQLDITSLYWLGGYCAGLAEAKQKPADSQSKDLLQKGASQTNALVPQGSFSGAKSNPLEVKVRVAVIYASQSGNGKALAEALQLRLGHLAPATNLSSELRSAAEIKVAELVQYQVLLVIASTHGEGEPPDDAIELVEALHSRRAPKLKATQHAVLALGDSSYEFFCQTGKEIDQALLTLGSSQLLGRVDCDVDYLAEAGSWQEKVVEKLQDMSRPIHNLDLRQNEDLGVPTAFGGAQPEAVPSWSREKPFSARVVENQRITGRGSSKQVHHLELSLESSGIVFQPGDSLAIWPKNNPSLVDEILSRLGLTGEEPVALAGSGVDSVKILKNVLLENKEITLLNPTTCTDYLSLTSGNDDFKRQLTLDFHAWAREHQFIDLIKAAPVQLTGQQLVDLLKPVKPRSYSIASSLQAFPGEVHLTVGLKQSENESGIRSGAASHYLIEQLRPDDEVLVYPESNPHFRLADDNAPILMIGPGTGIAPFRGFLQARASQKAKGENWLIFGNPHFNSDFLYQTELQEYLRSGLLSRLDLAFSRDQAEKIYVQQRLWEQSGQVWQWLNDKKAHVYVCGDKGEMAKAVEATLIRIIAEQGGMSEQAARDYLKNLQKTRRYQKDVY